MSLYLFNRSFYLFHLISLFLSYSFDLLYLSISLSLLIFLSLTPTAPQFRSLQVDHGIVRIDEWDLSMLSLYDLRSHVQFIPSDPPLFSGTLR